MRTLVKWVALLFFAASTVVLAGPATAFVDRDCGDFDTQRQAQLFFLEEGGPTHDPHRLDADGDGIACETLPCPCYYDTAPPADATPKKKKKKKTLRQPARILRVVDGDTVRVRLTRSGSKRTVRLIGIDTPEVHGSTDCWGPEASKWLKKRLPARTRVRLVSDPTQDRKDRYGRLLRYVVKVKGGRDMNRAQVWAGNAKVYVYAGKPFKRTKSYRKAQRQAKKADRGLWGNC